MARNKTVSPVKPETEDREAVSQDPQLSAQLTAEDIARMEAEGQTMTELGVPENVPGDHFPDDVSAAVEPAQAAIACTSARYAHQPVSDEEEAE